MLLDPNTPKKLSKLLKRCWDATPSKRPTAESAIKSLNKIAFFITPPMLNKDLGESLSGYDTPCMAGSV